MKIKTITIAIIILYFFRVIDAIATTFWLTFFPNLIKEGNPIINAIIVNHGIEIAMIGKIIIEFVAAIIFSFVAHKIYISLDKKIRKETKSIFWFGLITYIISTAFLIYAHINVFLYILSYI